MGLGMFWWFKRPRLLNLSLIYEIMKICEKNEMLYVLETSLQLPHCPNFGQNKQWTLYTFWAAFSGGLLPLKSKYIMDLVFLVQT